MTKNYFAFLTVRSHRRRREHQSGRKSFIFNVSRRRAPARAARRVLNGDCAFTPQAARASKWPEVIHFQCEPASSSGESVAARFGRLKSSQLHGNEL